jgi:pSer/pThr/pTyr-binding forkhead associated (FHA) protein
VPESLLTILKFCFLALLYLFLLRVVRAVWAEVAGPRATRPVPAAASPAPARSRRDRGSAKGVLRLRVVEPAEQRGRAYELSDELTVGRAAGCQITLDDTYASQLHARVFRKDNQLFVEDLGSTNGTYIGNERLTRPMPVGAKSRVRLGKTVLELRK